MVYSYYPGCTLNTSAKELDKYARLSAEVLGFTLEEIPEWQCCGAVYPMGADEVVSKLPAIRALHYAKTQNRPLVTLCSACHHVLKRVNEDMRNNEELRKIVYAYDNDLEYTGETNVLHYLEVLRDYVGFDILQEKAANRLKGRKIGAYYGCMLLRPSSAMQFDDPENPKIFEDFIRAIGAEPVLYPYRNECCGGYISLREKKKAKEMTRKITDSALQRGANELITACPLCQYNVEKMQGNAVPIYYFTKFLAEALNIEEVLGD